jgi:hypothetical protein
MVPESIHDFFLGSAGVAGALIGLLFVAISVSAERLSTTEAAGQVHRIRARGSLTAFTNALAVSLFALIPDGSLGTTTLSVGIVGLVFVLASMLSLIRLIRVHRARLASLRDGGFLIGMAVAFVVQIVTGINVMNQPGNIGPVETIAILVIVFFLVGISRAWELIGGPTIGFTHEVVAFARREEPPADGEGTQGAPAGDQKPDGHDAGRDEAGPGEPARREPSA